MKQLSAYELACGDVQRFELNATRLTLWREHGCYHVREHHAEYGRRFWYSYRTLTQARARFSIAKHVIRKLKGHC